MSEALTFPSLKRAEHTTNEFDREAPVKLWHGLYIKAAPESKELDPAGIFGRKCFPTHGIFQVGLLEGFEETDPPYYTLEGACYRAHRLSYESGVGSLVIYPAAYAVWDMPSGTIKEIFYCGEGFQP